MKIDHPTVQKILEGDPELAKKYGYIPMSKRTQVFVAYDTPRARLNELIADGFRPVVDMGLARAMGQIPDPPRIETDPITGRKEYRGSFHSVTSITPAGFAGFTGTPPVVLERSRIFGGKPINRFALSPGRDFVAQALPASEIAGEGPTFFASGDLPPLTGSGCDPAILPWCAWEMRHSAAYSDSRAMVLEIIEASAEGITEPELTNEPGRSALNRYIGAIHTWANTAPFDDRENDPRRDGASLRPWCRSRRLADHGMAGERVNVTAPRARIQL
jgi:hypothetical protein